MQIIYARQLLNLEGTGIFLAGPTPRKEYPYSSWRPDAIKLFERYGYTGTLLVPEDKSGTVQCDYDDQIDWELRAMAIAHCIMFWVPRKLPEMPGFTTNVEFGYWVGSNKIVFGAPEWAEKIKYLKHLCNKYNIYTHDALNYTVLDAIALVEGK